MIDKDREIYLLNKRIENRENTIKWLNDIIDRQSEKNQRIRRKG